MSKSLGSLAIVRRNYFRRFLETSCTICLTYIIAETPCPIKLPQYINTVEYVSVFLELKLQYKIVGVKKNWQNLIFLHIVHLVQLKMWHWVVRLSKFWEKAFIERTYIQKLAWKGLERCVWTNLHCWVYRIRYAYHLYRYLILALDKCRAHSMLIIGLHFFAIIGRVKTRELDI